MRPTTLAEVVTIAGQADMETFGVACDEFCDAFYLDYPDKTRMQSHLDSEPKTTGKAVRNAFIGAVAEHLALRWNLKVPAWTARPMHYALKKPVFMPPSKALMPQLIIESPSAFRSRLIFTMAEPLRRARFPADVEVIRMPWDVGSEK
jgi:hypothetical protein